MGVFPDETIICHPDCVFSPNSLPSLPGHTTKSKRAGETQRPGQQGGQQQDRDGL